MQARVALQRKLTAALAFHLVMFELAVLSIVTSLLDVAWPVFTGEPLFGRLFALADGLGYGYLWAHIILHNLGMACIVPGFAALAMSKERDRRSRRAIPGILLVAVVLSLVSSLQFLATEQLVRSPMTIFIALLEVEAVLVLAVAGYFIYRDFVPTRELKWSLLHPARKLWPYFAVAYVSIAVAASLEVLVVVGA